MYKGGKIIASLVVFVAVLGIPFFYNMGKANAGPENLAANLEITKGTQCVEPASYMLENHMQLLNQWRQAYVRDGQTVYVNSQGDKFPIDINTCIRCHTTGSPTGSAGVINPALTTTGTSNPALTTTGASNTAVNNSDNFCVACHNYASVEPTCWSCHSETGEATK